MRKNCELQLDRVSVVPSEDKIRGFHRYIVSNYRTNGDNAE